MTQTLPLSLTLGAPNTGKFIGYSVLNLDRTEYASFALATESSVPGTYYADAGYSAPDAGGYVVVSESNGGDPAVLAALVEVDVEPKVTEINSVVGTVDANLVSILGTAITETAGLIAAAFSKFFNKATPTGTVNSLPDAVAGAVNGLAIVGSEMDLVDAPNAMAIDAIQAGLSLLGSGAITFTYTLESSVDASPIADADVWVTTDSAGSNVIAVGRTNAAGQVVFYLDAGPVYVWRQKTGWTFANPDTEVVA